MNSVAPKSYKDKQQFCKTLSNNRVDTLVPDPTIYVYHPLCHIQYYSMTFGNFILEVFKENKLPTAVLMKQKYVSRHLPIAIKQAAKRPAPALQISLVKRYTETDVIPLKKNHL